MRKLKRLLEILFIMVTIVIALTFLIRNQAPVNLDLLIFQSASLDSGTLVIVAFILGACLGLVVRIPDAIWRALAQKIGSSSKPNVPPEPEVKAKSSALVAGSSKGR